MLEPLRRHPGPRGQRPALVLCCLILILTLGQAAAGLTAPGDAVPTNADALRAQVAAAGWVTVRVEVRAPAAVAATDDLEQAAQDLLFALPAGSYDGVERAAGSASSTLRVDATGLDALLRSPWAASVSAAGNPEMQRLAAGAYTAWPSSPTAASGPGDTTSRANSATAPPPSVQRRSKS